MHRIATVLTVFLTTQAVAQTVPTTRLTKPDATFTEPFSEIVGLRETASGRVFVADALEQQVALLDFASGDMTPIGRQGGGPDEFGAPGPMLGLPGDSTIMMDTGNRRGLVIGPTGQVATTVSFAGVAGAFFLPRWADARGRLYGQPPLMLAGSPGGAPEIPDSMPLVRWDRSADGVDTVLMLPNPLSGGGGAVIMVRGTGAARPSGPLSIGGGRQRAYYPSDAWVVAPDGRVALVRAETYRVEWVDALGRKTVGPTIPYERIRVTKADQDAWIQSRTAGTRMVVNGRRMTPPPIDPKDVDWAEFKPPFQAGAVGVTPEGELWVLVSQPAGAKGALYDVFDQQARRIRRVQLPDERRLVGFGRGTVYAVHKDADDLEWLERYRRPAADDR